MKNQLFANRLKNNLYGVRHLGFNVSFNDLWYLAEKNGYTIIFK